MQATLAIADIQGSSVELEGGKKRERAICSHAPAHHHHQQHHHHHHS